MVVDERVFCLPYAEASTSAEYMKSVQRDVRIPRTIMTRSVAEAVRAAQMIGYPCIVKTTNSRKGRGVALAKCDADVRVFAREHLTRDGISIVVREWIPNEGDLRVLVIGGTAFGALARTPKPGEFRANISQGGSGKMFDLSSRPDVVRIAETMARACGLAIAGVDIMFHKETGEPYLLEVNESPQIEGFETYTGLNAAGRMIEYFESLLG